MGKPLKVEQGTHPIEGLIELMRRLRDPEIGCPWDLEQDLSTITPYTIEEAYEVDDAVRRDDKEALREELGDLLLQPVYLAQIAAEKGWFTIDDVILDITQKMVSRHPHVFASLQAQDSKTVDKIWDERKDKEKKGDSYLLDSVTKGLPALLHAQKLQKKAAKVGFEWTETGQVLDKLEEEINEMRQALKGKTTADQAEELGDILFVLANLGRQLGINAETALRESNNKFISRFNGIEDDLKNMDKDFCDLSLDELQKLWDRQKFKSDS